MCQLLFSSSKGKMYKLLRITKTIIEVGSDIISPPLLRYDAVDLTGIFISLIKALLGLSSISDQWRSVTTVLIPKSDNYYFGETLSLHCINIFWS